MSRKQLTSDYGKEETQDDPEPLVHQIQQEYETVRGKRDDVPSSGMLSSLTDIVTHPFVCGIIVAAICGKYILWAAARV